MNSNQSPASKASSAVSAIAKSRPRGHRAWIAAAILSLAAASAALVLLSPGKPSAGPALRGQLDVGALASVPLAGSRHASGVVRLSGEWELLDGGPAGRYALLPRKWEKPFGHAAYRLRLVNLDPEVRYAISVQYLDTSFRLLADGREIYAGGKAGATPEASSPAYRAGVANLPEGIRGTELILEVSNFVHMRGGPTCALRLGPQKAIVDLDAVNALFGASLVGILAILGLLCLFNAALRASGGSLFYGLCCLGGAYAFFTMSPDVLIYRFFPGLSWGFYVRSVFLAVVPAPLMILLASRSLFGGITDRAAIGLSLPVAAAALASLFAPYPVLNILQPPIMCYDLFLLAVCLAVNARAVRHGYPHAKAALAGNAVIVLEILSIALFTQQKVDDSPFLVLSFLYAVGAPGRAGRFAIGLASFILAFLPLYSLSGILFLDSAARRMKPEPGDGGRAASVRGRCAQLGLSPRETDVVMLALEGKRNKDISDSLFISVNTVKTHLSKAFTKAGIKARSELFAFFRS